MNKLHLLLISLLMLFIATACVANSGFRLPENSPFDAKQPEEAAGPDTTITAESTSDGAEDTEAAASAAQTSDGGFVRRDGSELLIDGEPFHFVGTNAFFLQPEMVYGNREGVEETLDKAIDAGFTVIRMWGFNDKEISIDPAAIQTAPGRWNEGSLMALDRVMALIKERNLRVILPLVNNWQDYGGIPRYLEWCDCDAEHGDFYTNETMRGWYRNYVEMLLTRVNTITGIAYRDEPTILAWELGNELRYRGGDPAELLAWHAEMAAFIKSIDANHLVADGGEGFDNNPSLYPDLGNTYPVRGSEGASFHQMATIDDIDMVSYHLYPDHWDLDPVTDGIAWIASHESIARQANKVAYLGEFGLSNDDDAARASVFRLWLNTALVENQSSGALVWNLVYNARPNSDGFNIYCPADAATCEVLQQ